MSSSVSCWTFGFIAAAETAILSSEGATYEETGLDLSERHLAYFGLDHITEEIDPTQVGEGIYTVGGEDETAILGDADGDDEVTIFDATAIQKHLAELSAESFDEKAADADEDGEITVFDATEIQKWLAEMPSNENIGKAIGSNDGVVR